MTCYLAMILLVQSWSNPVVAISYPMPAHVCWPEQRVWI